MRFSTLRGALALLVTVAVAACGYSSAYQTVAPPDAPPPTAAFSAGLWTVSGGLSEISRLDDTQLLTGGIKTPATALSTSRLSLFNLNSIAFDATGTMWIASREDSALAAFTNGTEAGLVSPTIIITPTSRSLAGPGAMAFDSDRSLWVANFSSGTIVRFDRTQITASGSPVPTVTIRGVAHPSGLAFDATGALWVTDALDNTVSRYLRGQLLTSGDKPPATVLSSADSSLVNPSGIAFDSFNNMWIANTGRNSVVAFRPPQRASTGSPAPFLRLAPELMPLESPASLAFDQTGNLWIMGISGLLSKFTALEIAASGPAEPSLQIRLSNHLLMWSIAFWPTPSGFPLH